MYRRLTGRPPRDRRGGGEAIRATRSPRRGRLTATAAVSGALTLSLTGCLGGGGEKTRDTARDTGRDTGGAVKLAAAQLLARVSDKAGQADSYRSHIVTRTRMTMGSRRLEVGTDMRMAIRHRPSLAMSGTVTTSGMAAGGARAGRMRMILVDRTMYMNLGSPRLTGGKPWARVPLDRLTAQGGADPLKEAERNGPAEQARLLTTSGDVREVGRETINGVPTTHYAGTVDPARGFAKMSPEHRRKFEEMYKRLKVKAMRIELWVGRDGLPRKQRARITLPNGGEITTTGHFTGYGEPVRITPPPANQVGELTRPGTPNLPRV
ncbi:MAG TPA: hypothetical protein VHJ17_13630 [Thermomonospora sp.]|nr:hypothetical protein [Thermomonospora sp.]